MCQWVKMQLHGQKKSLRKSFFFVTSGNLSMWIFFAIIFWFQAKQLIFFGSCYSMQWTFFFYDTIDIFFLGRKTASFLRVASFEASSVLGTQAKIKNWNWHKTNKTSKHNEAMNSGGFVFGCSGHAWPIFSSMFSKLLTQSFLHVLWFLPFWVFHSFSFLVFLF